MRNEGTLDRGLRGIGGIALLALALFSDIAVFNTLGGFWASMVIGGVLTITAITGFCPAYRILGLKTCADC
ncbi:hypothetical protein JANAI62_24450 [Jannaschia pagri]|uniref:Inner membrane protein YgaP-like transmembrane domain-containing protein n=1 Tax=Jannaschia pagri TaxID=2829797 RepID=A0ABQ4NN35_9RHOB|nr:MULTISPECIES: DUF2892 domain-containing protein [unclassified Jannaschia]GIT91988.1 hypothetical protein JANAI61_24460 [Jannaschia sp. AI_61]GIT95822.1 hypothetical protein JANAI62_24450 [Jannaschia sp. AI_62]